MGRIQKLDANTANMIAAGEVVERPMGVVKELIENAIDAESSRIDILIEEGGMKKLTVQDNGVGMDSQDAVMAFERHATSKIKTQNDLWSIHTLGFRGEALPSIASVARVTLETSDGNESTQVIMEYGSTVSVAPYPCNQGTSITVEGLFYRTPARLKHMRSASYEASLIQDVIIRFALSHPEIAFHYYNEGREAFATTGQNDLLEVLYQAGGRAAAENAVEADFSDYDYHVHGYIVKPAVSRASRSAMNLFLNGRMVRTYRLYKAVSNAYQGYLPEGRYPMVVLSIDMDPHILDVNVHPSKWEVRLSKENQLEAMLAEGVRNLLVSTMPAIAADTQKARVTYYEPMSFDPDLLEAKEEKPAIKEEPVPQETKSVQEVMDQPEDKPVPEAAAQPQPEVPAEPEELLPGKAEEIQPEKPEEIQPEMVSEPVAETVSFPQLEVIGQYKDRYILASAEAGLVLIDPKRAMERIQYEDMLKRVKEPGTMVPLLTPLVLPVTEDITRRLEEINKAAETMQVCFEEFGRDTLMVREIPSWMMDLDAESFLTDYLDVLRFQDTDASALMQKKKTAVMAEGYVKYRKKKLTMEEMQILVRRLSQCENGFFTVRGKPVIVVLHEKELDKEFAV
ncbi:MAG: DNA mismatch repair endonuclease MutL [Solobacterium sp.]|nr:DNA mismatch repair endonuclease MutL [Solobacterium sp.]